MKNKIEDLRNHLFATLEALRDQEKPMELARAKAIAEVAQVVVNTAKVEIEHMDLLGGGGTGFIPRDEVAVPTLGRMRLLNSGLTDSRPLNGSRTTSTQ